MIAIFFITLYENSSYRNVVGVLVIYNEDNYKQLKNNLIPIQKMYNINEYEGSCMYAIHTGSVKIIEDIYNTHNNKSAHNHIEVTIISRKTAILISTIYKSKFNHMDS